MNNLVKIALTTGAVAVGIIVIFLGLDTVCLGSGATACRVWKGFQWESIVAGALGLAGGIFVIASTRQQIHAQREDMASAELKPVDTIIHRSEAVLTAARAVLADAKIPMTDYFIDGKSFVKKWETARRMVIHTSVFDKAAEDLSYPKDIRTAAKRLGTIIPQMNRATFSSSTPTPQLVKAVAEMTDILAANLADIIAARHAHAEVLMRR
ncbi:hypothetical protein TH8_19720 [Thalassospira profundimaris]|nr:hypothetical protein TH8_19720 [Thalassospira profundimaris]